MENGFSSKHSPFLYLCFSQEQIEYNEGNYKRYSLMRTSRRFAALKATASRQSFAKKGPEQRKIFLLYTVGRIVHSRNATFINHRQPRSLPRCMITITRGCSSVSLQASSLRESFAAVCMKLSWALASFTAGIQKATVY